MKLSVPWSVKGIRPEARETAREAARRSGMSLGEWLNTVILHQAAEDGSEDDEDEVVDSRELTAVNQKLDDLSRRIEQFARKSAKGPEAYAPKPREQDDSGQIAELINRLDRQLDQFVSQSRPVASPPLQPAMHPQMYAQQMAPQQGFQQPLPNVPPVRMPPALDMAVAEIAARQRALNGQPPVAATPQRSQMAQPAQQPVPQPVLMPVPQQDLSGLEDQLRKITNQIETLRKPGVEEAINALRAELGDIAHALTDAMPRQAIDTIERQIQGLTHRIAEGKQAGVDANQLTGVELGLAEVRDALRTLTPAENLVGFNDAVAGLAHKIDLIVADKNPETLHQLEHAITTLRDMASHVASTEAVTGLAQHVEQLADRVEHLAASNNGSDALNHLEHRISALADALAQRSESGANVPPMLESLVQSLSDKIELIQQNRGDSLASSALEDQIVALVQRLDASDSRLGHLEAVERGLADLLVHMEELRTNKNGGGLRAEPSPVVDELKSDMARTQDALHQVNGTLGTLVDRLAKLESGIRSGGPAPASAPPMAPPPMPVPAEHQASGTSPARKRPVSVEEFNEARQPIGRVVARAVVDPQPAAQPPLELPPAPVQQPYVEPQQAQQPVRRQAPQPQQQAPEPAPVQKRLPQAHNLPINPDLPPDEPLEPGSGPPKFRANPGARIAASEAALGGAGPNSAGGKSGFIAAARRAANAALQSKAEHSAAPPAQPQVKASADILELDDPDQPSLRGKLMKRVKSLFIAASIAAVVIGSIQIAGTYLEFGKSDDAKTARRADDDLKTASTATPDATNRIAANPLAPAKPAAPADYVAPSMPSLLSPPAMTSRPAAPSTTPVTAPSAAVADVTGSIPTPNVVRPPVTLPSTPAGDRLPPTIGGNKLRSAAVAGDAAAAYEVAVRFAEGRGVPVSLDDAARWYERAAAKGLAPAQFRYASLLEKGQGVKKDLVQARKLYLAAAGKGNGKAMHNLAVLYAEGADGRPDYVNAAQWFRKAAQRGVADSQYNLGVLCARGLGTEKNAAESYQWFALAAAQGDKESAKKRDEITAHMDAETLALAQRNVQNFRIEPQPSDAISVPEPAGGWDGLTSAPAAKPRQVGPLSLGSLQTGTR